MGEKPGERICGKSGRRRRTRFPKGSADVRLREFFRDNERFADVFNSFLFQGTNRIAPEELQEMDTNVSASILSRELQEVLKRTRDIVKFDSHGTCYRILGIEHQQHIHYAMPLRTMIYDSLTYLRHAEGIGRRNRKDRRYRTVDEFLSGMRKGDRLIPCYTMVIYWGEEKWDGPRSLGDMMEFGGRGGNAAHFQDYGPAALICVNELEEYPFQNTDVFQLFQAVHELYKNAGRQMPETLESVGVMTAYTAAAITGTTKELRRALADTGQEGKERVDMCKAFQRALKEERAEGRVEGKVEGQAEMAGRLIKEGVAPETVRKSTQLSEKEWAEVMKSLA